MSLRLDDRFAPAHHRDPRAMATLDRVWQRAMANLLSEEPPEPPTVEELAYAQAKGYWHPDESAGHEATVDRLIAMREGMETVQVGRAFALGLAWNRPEWWGALGSVAFARHLVPHPNTVGKLDYVCAECGLPRAQGVRSDENKRWTPGEDLASLLGGGPLLSVTEVTSHLWFLRQLPPFPAPNQEECARVGKLIELCRRAEPKTTAPQLAKSLREMGIKSPDQRVRVVEMLAAAGILAPRDAAGTPMSYGHGWVRFEATQAGNPRDDTLFPARIWRGVHGVDDQMLTFWLGEFLRA